MLTEEERIRQIQDEDRPFSRRTSALIGLAAFAGAIAVALYVYYGTLTGFAGFFACAAGIFVLQGLASLCLVDVLRLPRAMRSGLLWVMARLAAGILVGILAATGLWTYDGWIAIMALVVGVIDLWLVDDSR